MANGVDPLAQRPDETDEEWAARLAEGAKAPEKEDALAQADNDIGTVMTNEVLAQQQYGDLKEIMADAVTDEEARDPDDED